MGIVMGARGLVGGRNHYDRCAFEGQRWRPARVRSRRGARPAHGCGTDRVSGLTPGIFSRRSSRAQSANATPPPNMKRISSGSGYGRTHILFRRGSGAIRGCTKLCTHAASSRWSNHENKRFSPLSRPRAPLNNALKRWEASRILALRVFRLFKQSD